MIRIEEMSVRLGMLMDHQLAFPPIILAAEFLRPSPHSFRMRLEGSIIDGDRSLKHDPITLGRRPDLITCGCGSGAKPIEIATVEVKQSVPRHSPVVSVLCQQDADLPVAA